MRYATVCSGAEAFGHDWHEMGYECVFHSEINKDASAVLNHHYPTIPNHGDFTKIDTSKYPNGFIQLLAGGTPCQDYSIAGLRAGLKGANGNLTLGFLALAKELQPKWILWENVPGVLSSDGGRAFGAFLGGLAQLGYGTAYRVLDAQYFGVPQRRRRVFVVGYLGDWRPPAAVLFESESLQRDTPPRREKGQRLADSLTVGANQCSGFPGEFVETARCLTARSAGAQSLDSETANFIVSAATDVTVFDWNKSPSQQMHVNEDGLSSTLRSGHSAQPAISSASSVRRLTPLECERLMGWPDKWTKTGLTTDGKQYKLSDSARYRICGNGWAAPVVNWIAKRILDIENTP